VKKKVVIWEYNEGVPTKKVVYEGYSLLKAWLACYRVYRDQEDIAEVWL